jgi:glycine/D-amino acid oxidase-like deaminating enzyme
MAQPSQFDNDEAVSTYIGHTALEPIPTLGPDHAIHDRQVAMGVGFPMKVVICGGGVIGASIAYFLSLRQVETVVVERAGLAFAASGKAGGFLALDWCDGSPLAPLARRSFALHGELDRELGGDWGYRRLDTLSVVASARRQVESFRRLPSPAWLGPESAVQARLGTTQTTAQVNPADFTKAMMDAAMERGARLRIGSVTGLALTADKAAVNGVVVDGEVMAADAVVIAMGPWSVLASQWLSLPAVHGLMGHSLVFCHHQPGDPQALFVEFETEDGRVFSPEVFPRPDGTVYVCGVPGEAALPVDPRDVGPDPGAYDRLRAMTAQFAPGLGQAEVLAAQTCYRPIAGDGLPLIGRVAGVERAYVATGHSVWGILNGPATGEAMAELITAGAATTVDLRPFDPARLEPLEPRKVRTAEP